ncbi:hypothetical protein [Marinicella litoralis]|uniref:Phosphodiesterase n=1 Tax=Marinicella litoralis TaxID=644220 RepID=A0A4R6XKI3_9GAMM|nr:hypothetical protein [Marinicella litoralis]TDR18500.1 hypothetical protein C8D91_2420 [Marinicella litoralis]
MKTLIFAAILFIIPLSIHADVLLIERVEAKQSKDVPQKSSTMNQVRSQFGDPISESAPVGDPPITRWEYDGFLVYFEHQHVITSVLKKSKPTEIGPN